MNFFSILRIVFFFLKKEKLIIENNFHIECNFHHFKGGQVLSFGEKMDKKNFYNMNFYEL